MSKNANQSGDKNWIMAADAVVAAAASLGCSLDAAAEILLIYSRDRSTAVRCTSRTVDLNNVDFDPVYGDPSTGQTLDEEEWREEISSVKRISFDWTKSRVKTETISSFDLDGFATERVNETCILDGVCFLQADLREITTKKKTGAGGRPYGAFWPYLAEEAILWIYINGRPGEVGVTQAAAIDEISSNLEKLDNLNVKLPERTMIQSLLVRLDHRLANLPDDERVSGS